MKLWDHNRTQARLEKIKKKAIVIFTVLFFCMGIIVFRLIDLAIFEHDRLVGIAEKQTKGQKDIKPQRGIIWDRKMRQMATNVDAESVYVVPSRVEDIQVFSKRLSQVLRVSARNISYKLKSKREKQFLWIERKIDPETADKLREMMKRYKYRYIGLIKETKRYYPKGRTGAHIIGFTNVDNVGIAGIEMVYDRYLRGKKKSITFKKDARNNKMYSEINWSVTGNNLLLTIDEYIQYIVERELSEAVEKWEAKAASAIMMNPFTGEILAMANYPSFDPNNPGKYPPDQRRNRTVTDIYEPGSTIKTILAAAALEEGVVELDEEFDVSKGYIVVGGKAIRDVHKHEFLTFQEVIQKSSNVGAVQIGMRLGAERYYSYLRAFGFGEKTGIDYPGETRGILRSVDKWSGTSLAALSIGQEIGVTPLQVLRAYAVIANGGLLMRPYIVSDIISRDGRIIKSTRPKVIRRVISPSTAETVREILKTVVEEGGTATRAYIKGNLVAGKTGTAQVFDPETGRYSRKRHISSFVGFVPADNPRIALIVVIFEPKKGSFGGVVAAPVFRNIVEQTLTYLNVPQEDERNQIILVRR